MVKAKKFVYVKPYEGMPTHENVKIVEEEVPPLKDGENKNNPVGKYVVSQFGWRTHTISNGVESATPHILVSSTRVGETLVVSAAAGAIGSHVGQIGKIKGLKVIGITGSDAKNAWLKSLGFDYVINYKTQDVAVALKEAAPNGVDAYFDNVGGEISSTVMQQMNHFGRVPVCGAISSYNAKEIPKATILQYSLVFKQLKMQGFFVTKWVDRWEEGIKQNAEWIKEGRLQYQETVTEGFENALEPLVGVLRGDNTGKAVVKI